MEFEESDDPHQKELARRAMRAYADLQEIATSMHLKNIYLSFDLDVTRKEQIRTRQLLKEVSRRYFGECGLWEEER